MLWCYKERRSYKLLRKDNPRVKAFWVQSRAKYLERQAELAAEKLKAIQSSDPASCLEQESTIVLNNLSFT